MNTRTFGSIPKGRLVAIALVLALLMAAAYGFAAANTVAASAAGSGSQTISGYDVTDVAYTLNSTSPENLDAVSFKLAALNGGPAAATAQAKTAPGDPYVPCAKDATTGIWTCTLTGKTAAGATSLSVVAKSSS